jgi:hypothetical protein
MLHLAERRDHRVVIKEETRVSKSRWLDVGFGWVDVVGRGVEASVGGFEDTQRSVNKSLVVGWVRILLERVSGFRQFDFGCGADVGGRCIRRRDKGEGGWS